MKIKFDELPDGFEVRNGQIVESKQSGGSTGDQKNFGLVTTPKDGVADEETKVKYSMSPVPRDEANIEAEKGETVLTDLNGDGKFGLYDIKGKRHAKGGTPLFLPEQSFIYSDFNKMKFTKDEMEEMGVKSKKKLTPAKISKKFSINEFYESLKDPYADEIQAKTADLMLDKNKMQLSKLAFLQESKKEFEDGVPVSAFPFLVDQGQDPIEFTQKIEEVNRADAEAKFISSLPAEQQMQIAALQQYMQQVDQQQQQDQEMSQEQGMLPPPQDQQGMQQMDPQMQGMQPQGMPPQDQGMMPTPPDMNPQQMAQMGYEVESDELPIAQEGSGWMDVLKNAIGGIKNKYNESKRDKQQAERIKRYREREKIKEQEDAMRQYMLGNKERKIKEELERRYDYLEENGFLPDAIKDNPELLLDKDVASLVSTAVNLINSEQAENLGVSPSEYLNQINEDIVNYVNEQQTPVQQTPVVKKPPVVQQPVVSKPIDNSQLAIARPANTDPYRNPNYDKNKQAYKQLEQTLTDVNDVEMQGIIDQAYNRYLKNAKEQGLTSTLEKDDLVKEYLRYQKNNYNIRNLATEEQRFNPNLDKAGSIGKKKNQVAKELYDEIKKYNPDYEIYDLDEDIIKNTQLFFQTLWQVDSEKDNPRFGVEQLGPDQKTNWAKNRKISQVDGFAGNNWHNQFTYVANPKKPVAPDPDPVITDEEDDPINIQPNQLKIPYNPNDPRFWLQDLLKLNAIANRKRKKFYPWQPAVEDIDVDWVLEDPTRAIAATNEQMNLMAQGIGTFGGPQSFNARMANVQGKTAANVANVIAGVHNRNINTVNRGLAQQAQYDYMVDKENRTRKKQLYDDTMKVEQNALIEENFDREQYAGALANAYTNMANTYNMNTLYDNFNVDPTTGGMMYFTNPTALDPSPNYEYSKIKRYKKMNDYFKGEMNRPMTGDEIKYFMGEKDSQDMNNYQKEYFNKQNPNYIQGYDSFRTGKKGREIKKLLPFFTGHVGI